MVETSVARGLVRGALAAILGFLAASPCPGADPEPTLTQILASWRQREGRAVSGEFSWNVHETLSKEYFALPPDVQASSLPTHDATIEYPCSLTFDGNKMRYTHKAEHWSAEDSTLKPGEYVSVFDGLTNKYLTSRANKRSRGIIRADSDFNDVRNFHLHPVLLAYRPLQLRLAKFSETDLQISDLRPLINGQRTIVLQESDKLVSRPGRAGTRSIWHVDPQKCCAIVRHAILRDGTVSFQVDISYKADSIVGVVPVRWRIAMLNATGAITMLAEAEVTRVSLNQPIEPSTFEMAFPPGTYVEDFKANQKYFVRDDESVQVIAPSVWLDHGSVDEAIAYYQRRPSLWVKFGFVNILLLLCSGVLLWWWRRRGRRSAGGTQT